MPLNVISSDLDYVVVRDGKREWEMVRGNEFDSVKDSSPETLFAQHVWIFDFVEGSQMWNLDSWFCSNMIHQIFDSVVKELMLQNQRLAIWDILDWLVKIVNKLMLQNQRQAFGTLDGTCKTCKCIHATKSTTGTLGLWMGLVKLVKFVNTFILQNQRQTNNLYRIDSNQNLYRIILEVFTQKKTQHMFSWYFLMWGYLFCRKDEFALSDFFFVEGSWFCRR